MPQTSRNVRRSHFYYKVLVGLSFPVPYGRVFAARSLRIMAEHTMLVTMTLTPKRRYYPKPDHAMPAP